MFKYSDRMLSPSQIGWANYMEERQNSRRVPSPTKSAAQVAADLTWPSLYGNPPTDLNKDAFLGQFIHRIYCRECREQENMAAANQQLSVSSGSQPNSPPQYQMDQMSLATAMDANKEALTRRLMLRRSVNELVDAGIYPSLKAPAAFAEQRIHLERAKTGDILKHKIEQRPARDFLVQHHILEDSNIDPSLASTHRKLKKAKLTDELNEKLTYRPGPLELVQQSILEADDPLRTAIKEGKLEFHKTEDGVEPTIPKVPYEIESPKSGHSSPEPSDCDNDSNASSTTSTGFHPAQVPSPPDILPLISAPAHTSVTIGGKTVKIPITTQSFTPTQLTTLTVASQQFTSIPPIHRQQPSNFGANRNHRRTAKQNRPKQQLKQRVIKFHEYKGPSTSKSANSNSGSAGQFVTTTGPLQGLDALTPYQVRVQQQQLYLQCQLEIQNNNDTVPSTAVLVPIQAPPTPMMPIQKAVTERQEVSPPRQSESIMSRPVTPSLSMSMKSPPVPHINNTHKSLHLSRSLSQLEDMKVADLKQELKQRNLAVSGSKPQLIERLRNHQLQEVSVSIPSVSSCSGSEYNYSTSVPSVQSFSDETMMAPPSVASVMSNQIHSPPPCSPQEDFLRSPPSVMSKSHGMETDDNSQSVKSTADIVREQAKQIEELQRKLMQFQQQYPKPQPPYMTPGALPHKVENTSQPESPRHMPLMQQQVQEMANQQQSAQQLQQQSVQQLQQQSVQQLQQQLQAQQITQQKLQTPVDITDKQVYLATPDGKMTAYKVILHTGNGMVQRPVPRSEPSTIQAAQPVIDLNTQTSIDSIASQKPAPAQKSISEPGANKIAQPTKLSQPQTGNRQSRGIDVDDVLEVLIRTGEMDPAMINSQTATSRSVTDRKSESQTPSFSDNNLSNSQPTHSLSANTPSELELEEQLSPLAGMDWMDADPSDNLDLEGLDDDTNRPATLDTGDGNNFIFNDNGSLDWLSDVMHMDSGPSPLTHTMNQYSSNTCTSSTSDPILTPKPQDVMSIFHMEDTDFKAEPVPGIYWDKLMGQTSQQL